MITERLYDLELALWRARPHAVAHAALDALARGFLAERGEVYLADYQAAYLVPVTAGRDPLRIENSAPGRAFAAQDLVVESGGDAGRTAVHLPLAVYGEALGVLTLVLPQTPGDEARRELGTAAAVVARALAVADGRTDAYRRIRRRTRLTLAAEIQWELLPGRSCVTEEFELAGQLEPAYAVWGDNFDWSAAADHLTMTVTNGMGQGIDAALLTQLTIGALRNARRSDADLTEQAALASQAIYSQHRGDRHVGTLLLRFDLATGRVAAIDAGSPLIHLLRGDTVTRIRLDSQLPLGMFNDTEYVTEEFQLEPGDRLVIVSDGVHGSLSPQGELYGSTALALALARTRLNPPAEVVRTFVRDLLAYIDDSQLADDAVVVCLDWTGRPAGTVIRLDDHRVGSAKTS